MQKTKNSEVTVCQVAKELFYFLNVKRVAKGKNRASLLIIQANCCSRGTGIFMIIIIQQQTFNNGQPPPTLVTSAAMQFIKCHH